MNTDYVEINSDLRGREDALKTAEKFVVYNNITGDGAVHIRLLTEETLSMVNGILDSFRALLRLESEQKNGFLLCRIRLKANKNITEKQESKLLSVSSSGKNEAAKGILGKIREMFRLSVQRSEDASLNSSMMSEEWFSMGIRGTETKMIADQYMDCWSLNSYRASVADQKKDKAEEWDELEKSIISHLADDVKIYLKNESTEVVIEKKLKSAAK